MNPVSKTSRLHFHSGHAHLRRHVWIDQLELIDAIERAIAENKARPADNQARVDRLGSLTARERQVLSELLTGAINKQIAKTLLMAERTVKMHRSRIMRKLDARNMLDLARYKDIFNK